MNYTKSQKCQNRGQRSPLNLKGNQSRNGVPFWGKGCDGYAKLNSVRSGGLSLGYNDFKTGVYSILFKEKTANELF